jgi:hypothetical protein
MRETRPAAGNGIAALDYAMIILSRRRLRWGFVLAVALVGCAETTVTYTPLNAPPHELAARRPEQVQVFSSTPPERPHVDVGLISVQEGTGGIETPATLIWALRKSGGEKGCDALLLAPPSSSTKPTDLFATERLFQVYSATCIVYRSAAPGDAGATFIPTPTSSTIVDVQLPQQPSPDRRMCRDRSDFEATRNCVLATTHH